MTHLIRTNSNHEDFKLLSNLFDDFLVEIDGVEKDFFAKYNQIYIENVLIFYEDAIPLGCGAIKEINPKVGEIKRMFVVPIARSKGIATTILKGLEEWAKEMNFVSCQLETSQKLEKAIALYQKFGYKNIPNYGQYVGVASSICFRKEFTTSTIKNH